MGADLEACRRTLGRTGDDLAAPGVDACGDGSGSSTPSSGAPGSSGLGDAVEQACSALAAARSVEGGATAMLAFRRCSVASAARVAARAEDRRPARPEGPRTSTDPVASGDLAQALRHLDRAARLAEGGEAGAAGAHLAAAAPALRAASAWWDRTSRDKRAEARAQRRGRVALGVARSAGCVARRATGKAIHLAGSALAEVAAAAAALRAADRIGPDLDP